MATPATSSLPKYSLWLSPPTQSHFNTTLTSFMHDRLLTKHFSHEPHPKFSPHITLTSGFSIDIENPPPSESFQAWLEELRLPADLTAEKNEVVIELAELLSGDSYFQKFFIGITRNENLIRLVTDLRTELHHISPEDAETWVGDIYKPHLSLLYGDIAREDVDRVMDKVQMDLGFEMGDLFSCCGGSLAMGARLVLVDTSSKEVEAWKVLGERKVPWVNWRLGRNLL